MILIYIITEPTLIHLSHLLFYIMSTAIVAKIVGIGVGYQPIKYYCLKV